MLRLEVEEILRCGSSTAAGDDQKPLAEPLEHCSFAIGAAHPNISAGDPLFSQLDVTPIVSGVLLLHSMIRTAPDLFTLAAI